MRRIIPLLMLFGTACPVLAGPMVHHIEWVTPRAGQQGTTVEVTLEGTFLKEAREVLFFRPGIRCTSLKVAPSLPEPRNTIHGGWVEDKVVCCFELAPDCPLGLHPFKVRTATELTTLATFAVTRFPIVEETAEDQPVAMNVSVLGRMDSNKVGDVDVYRLHGIAGQTLSVEIDSVRLTDKFYAESEFDLMLRVLDDGGREIARNDDSAAHIQDPILSTVLPRDGEYRVEVKQRVFKTGDRCYYLAHLGDFQRPLAVYPAGGKAGTTLQTTLLGGASGDWPMEVALPPDAGDFDWIGGGPSPLPLRVSEGDNVLENGSMDPTPVAVLPAALNGIIARPGETDRYRLTVKKGERWRVRVFARSLGTPLDPRLTLGRPEAETPEWEADDATLEERGLYAVSRQIQRKELMDPAVIWEPKEDGDYLLGISDMRGLGSATSVYRIEIDPVADEVSTFIQARVIDMVECPRLTSIAVPQGGRWTVNVNLADGPGNSYKGELELVASGLPEGVTMVAPRIRVGQRQVPVLFTAAASTPPQATLITLTCRAVDGRPLVSRSQQSFSFLGHSGGHAWHSFTVDQYALAVTEAAPYDLEVGQPAIPLSQNGELSLPIKVIRKAGFDGPVEFQCDWLPPGVEGEPTVTLPAGQSESHLHLTATGSAVPETWKIAVTATTTGGSYYLGAGRTRVSSGFIDLTIAEPYLALQNKPSAVRRGESAQVVWEVQRKKPFAGTAEAALLGLPKGVTVKGALPLPSDAAQLVFDISASDEALLGQYKDLGCEITFIDKGQTIRQRTGRGILRVDPPVQGPAAKE